MLQAVTPKISLTGLVTMTLPLPDLTGAAQMALSFAQAIVDAGARVCVLHGAAREGHERILDLLKANGVELVFHPLFGPKVNTHVFRWIYGQLKRNRPDVVVSLFVTTDVKYVGPACRILGIPHVSALQNDIIFYGGPVVRWLKQTTFRALYQTTVDIALCTSEKTSVALRTNYGVCRPRVAVLPNAIDTKRISPLGCRERSGLRRELAIPDEKLLLINVGRIHPQKGQDILIEAVSRLDCELQSKIVVLLVGDSDNSKPESLSFALSLKGQVSEAGLDATVRFAGWREDVARLLAVGDAYIHSARYEGWPLAVLEGMAAGLPVIYSDCAGLIGGFVDGKHGYCVEAGQSTLLMKALSNLITCKPDKRQWMGENCRILVGDKYDIDVIGKRFVRLLSEAVEKSRAGISKQNNKPIHH